MVKEGGWTLAAEDPNLFLESKLDLKARREWPDEPYPQPAEPVPSTGDTPFYKEAEMAEFLKNPSSVHKADLRNGGGPMC